MPPAATFHRTFALVLAAALCGVVNPAAAQATLATSPALACLSRVDGSAAQPAYPPAALARKQGGSVRVQLTFSGPEAAPEVTILAASPDPQLDSAVTAHVRQFRVPCMQAGDSAVTLTQEYLFDALQQSRVMASPPRDSADVARAAQLACMAHVDGAKEPAYPAAALKRGDKGVLLVRMRFDSPSEAPSIEMVQAVNSPRLRRALTEYAAGLRLPCLQGPPVTIMTAYKYRFASDSSVLLRDSSLLEVLAAARDLHTPVQFDFNTMACPFDLRLSYARPFGENRVQQLDSDVPARRPLMDWLRNLTLKLSDSDSARVFGETFVISVPCSKLDL